MPGSVQVRPLFDAYIAVDWSAKNDPTTPGASDSIWIAALVRGRRPEPVLNKQTRADAEADLLHRLTRLTSAGKRVLVCFDFPYGYPRGFAAALSSGAGRPWRRNWKTLSSRITDTSRNRNNRFVVASALNSMLGPPGPFWGCPPASATANLLPTKRPFPHQVSPRNPLDEYRHVERLLRTRGSTPRSVWQLLGAGSVGSQSLMGIPVLSRLHENPALASVSKVWPFETGFTSQPTGPHGPAVIHAEIWPGAIEVDREAHEVKDAAQVLSIVRRFEADDGGGSLASWFDAPPALSKSELRECTHEEGWILGV